ncbi:hypothetical protein [Phytohabitans aurantiacus]|uniref:Uncharacterized protein n=1 Tax=Phytohabitans aurantiacus TaxID=3016789 RepID=A0ABQ5QZ30_9ACTN|nr:hypothetical protein [Phytohabitans aurantiacus]GLH99808.1 hypothetical protein Pa4123_50850 [Phytohabitans aurantiacus]
MKVGNGSAVDDPVGVISVVVADEANPGMVLLGVRRPSALSPRHPGVLSTPTLRLPADVFGLLTADMPEPVACIGIYPVNGPEFVVGRGGYLGSAHPFAVESLFGRKLGLADSLVDGRFEAVAVPRFLALDAVEDPLGTGEIEWTAILTYGVHIRRAADAIPTSTASYSRLLWASSAKLPRAVAHRDALLLDETLDAIEVCVQGLCLRAAVHMLTAATGEAAL